MKKIIFLTLIAFLFACDSENNNENSNNNSTEIEDIGSSDVGDAEDADEVVSLEKNHYIHLTGAIDDTGITADFTKKGDDITLVYYYNNLEEPITLSGKIDENNEFSLKQMVLQGKPYETFTGKFTSAGKIEGKWGKTDNNSKLAYELKENKDKSVIFEVYSLDKEIKNDDADCTDNLIFYYPKSSSKLQDAILKTYFKSKAGEPETLLKEFNQSFFADFKSEDNMGMPWSRNQMSDIIFNDNDILCYAVHWDSYSGGAHANYSSMFYVFNSRNGNRYNLNDIIIESKKEEIQQIVKNKIITERELTKDDISDIYELPIELNNNFYINKGGLGFYYNSYDIAAFAHGPDNVYIPFKELKGLIEKDFFNKIKN